MKILSLGAELFHADGQAGKRTGRHTEIRVYGRVKSSFSTFCQNN